jgi:hypothetical protein
MTKKKKWAARAALGGAAAILLAGPAAAVPMTQVPMLDCNGMACVEARAADGAQLRLFIDTGGVRGSLDAQRAAALKMATEPLTGRDGKPYPGYAKGVLAGLSVGGASLGDPAVTVYDMAGHRARQGISLAADGTLGYSVFADRILELDYAHHMVRISDKLSETVPCEGPCAQLELLTFGKKGPPMLIASGFKVNGKDVRAQLDTMFTGTMLVYPDSVDKLGLGVEAAGTDKEHFPWTDGGVDMLRSKGTLGFGATPGASAPLYFATPGVHLPDGLFDGTAGVGYFRDKVVTINLHDKWVKVTQAR